METQPHNFSAGIGVTFTEGQPITSDLMNQMQQEYAEGYNTMLSQQRQQQQQQSIFGALASCASQPLYPLQPITYQPQTFEDMFRNPTSDEITYTGRWSCKWGCGYKNDDKDVIKDHERSCKK